MEKAIRSGSISCLPGCSAFSHGSRSSCVASSLPGSGKKQINRRKGRGGLCACSYLYLVADFKELCFKLQTYLIGGVVGDWILEQEIRWLRSTDPNLRASAKMLLHLTGFRLCAQALAVTSQQPFVSIRSWSALRSHAGICKLPGCAPNLSVLSICAESLARSMNYYS